jgi:hypothetical protein
VARARRRLSPDVLGASAGRWIATQRLLGATFLLAVSLATIDQTQGGLPPPRRYAAISLLWFIFGLAAELGGQVARFVGALSTLVVLAMAMGTAGKRALAWLGEQAQLLQAEPLAASEAAPPGAAGFGGPLVGGSPRTRGGAGGGGGAW